MAWELLKKAVINNSAENVKFLVESGEVDVTERDEYGNTVLHQAIQNNCSSEIFHFLLRHVNPALRNEDKHIVQDLFYNSTKNCDKYKAIFAEYVLELIRHEDVHHLDDWVSLGWPIPDPNDSIFDKLLDNKKDFVFNLFNSWFDFRGEVTRLHDAVLKSDVDGIIHLGVAANVVCALDANGLSSVHKAVILDRSDVLTCLLKVAPVSANATDYLERTPLHYACGLLDEMHAYNILVAADSNEELCDVKGKRPCDYKPHDALLNIDYLKKTIGKTTSRAKSKETFTIKRRDRKNIPEFATEEGYYLFETMGRHLSKGISEVVQVQPVDPIEYLAHWLYKRRVTIDYEEKEKVAKAAIEAERAMYVEKKRLLDATKAESDRLKEENRLAQEQILLAKFDAINPAIFDPFKEAGRDKNGRTALHQFQSLTSQEFLDMVVAGHNFCLKDKDNVNVRTLAQTNNRSDIVNTIDKIICHLFKKGDSDTINSILRYDYDADIPSVEMIENINNKKVDKTMLKYHKSIKNKRQKADTLVRHARNGTIDTFRANVKSDDELLCRDRDGRNILMHAIQRKNLSVSKFLISSYPNLTKMTDNCNRKALHYAYAGGEEFVKIVLEADSANNTDIHGKEANFYEGKPALLPLAVFDELPTGSLPREVDNETSENNQALSLSTIKEDAEI